MSEKCRSSARANTPPIQEKPSCAPNSVPITRIEPHSEGPNFGEPRSAEPRPPDTVFSEAQKLWLTILERISVAYPGCQIAAMDGARFKKAARAWADELRAVPDERVWQVYRETMDGWTSSYAPAVGDFRAGWKRVLASLPRETYGQQEAREQTAARASNFALEAGDFSFGPSPTPTFVQIHRKLGFSVCCECRHRDGARKAAQILPSGERWVCASGRCGFSMDANDEAAALRAMKSAETEPKPNPIPPWTPPPAPPPKSPAHRLAELYDMDLDRDFDLQQTAIWRAITLWLGEDAATIRERYPTGPELWAAYAQWFSQRTQRSHEEHKGVGEEHRP